MAKEVSRHIYGDHDKIRAELKDKIVDHLCAVWGWLPDEEEAHILGEQLAGALFDAVANTYTQPASLLDALLYPRPSEFSRGADVFRVREKS